MSEVISRRQRPFQVRIVMTSKEIPREADKEIMRHFKALRRLSDGIKELVKAKEAFRKAEMSAKTHQKVEEKFIKLTNVIKKYSFSPLVRKRLSDVSSKAN